MLNEHNGYDFPAFVAAECVAYMRSTTKRTAPEKTGPL